VKVLAVVDAAEAIKTLNARKECMIVKAIVYGLIESRTEES